MPHFVYTLSLRTRRRVIHRTFSLLLEAYIVSIMQPIRMEDDIAVFTLNQINILGDPEYYGFEKYMVIDNEPEFVLSVNHWKQSYLIPKHRYSRIARFRSVVLNLLGEAKMDFMARLVVEEYFTKDTSNDYDACRKILKSFKMQKEYKTIPSLLFACYGIKLIEIPSGIKKNTSAIIQEIYTRFIVFESLFNQMEKTRKYFPSLRYTALRIMEGLGFDTSKVEGLRTKRKVVSIDLFFTKMENLRNKNF